MAVSKLIPCFCMLALFLSSSQVQFNRLAPCGYGVGISTSSATASLTSSFPVTTSAISRVRYSCISSIWRRVRPMEASDFKKLPYPDLCTMAACSQKGGNWER